METVGTTVAAKQGFIRKPAVPEKDLCESVRNGTHGDVDAALLALKRNNGNIDARNSFGSTALHIAVWRNHIPIVRRLLAAGADVDIRDGESGWSSLHRALHFGHLAVAGVLIESGANISLEDSKGRTPIDLVSGPVKQVISVSSNAGGTEVFSWGNGANYQLGTGTAGIQKLPCRLDNLQGLHVTAIAAAKFHSVAATADGQLYSWGFGRGGRLGHADFHIHSGQMAVITPRLVECGLVARRVKMVAVAKHHTVVATNGGEVFTWGSNREGQLGYTSVDTQATPRRVTSLKSKVVAVAAANKHTAVLTDVGEVFTWGCNREGQLGYGTSNSASNPIPRAVEYLKGKNFSAVSAAKYHTVVLGSEGEVFTWGYKMVMPKRVLIARNTRKGGMMPLKFHQAERLHVVAIAAGTTHSTALSEDGLIFYWVSSDPHLRCYQLLSMAGHQAVAVAAGKYRTAIVTEVGNVYAWDGEKAKVDVAPSPFRIHGIKRATHIAVGENHSLAVAAVYIPKYPPEAALEPCPLQENLMRDPGDFEGDVDSEDLNLEASTPINCLESARQPCETPSLKDLCQKVMAHYVVEPKNALQLLEVADCLGAMSLRKHCEDLVLHNLDYLLTISPMAFAHVTPTLLAEVEKSLDASSSQPWSSRHLPTPTAVFPVVVDSEEDEFEMAQGPRMRPFSLSTLNHLTSDANNVSESMFCHETEVDKEMVKQLRALRKKLQQIEALELKQAKGHILDHQQEAKLRSKLAIVDALLAIDPGAATKIGVMVVSTELSSDLPTENFQGKENVSRRSSSVRKKSNKSNFEQPSGEEHGKKSKNGRCKRGNLKKEQITTAAQDKQTGAELLFQPPTVEQVQICDKENNSTTLDHQVCDRVPRNGGMCNQISGFSPVSKKSDQSIQTGRQAAAIYDTVGSSFPVQNTEQVQKKRNKKGGLSMFLSGALDDAPKLRAQVPTVPKVEGPAWGGVKRNKGLASLREIQSQQTAEGSSFLTEELLDGQSCVKSVKAKQISSKPSESEILETDFDNSDLGACRIPLCQFIRSSVPIAVAPVKAPKVSSGLHPDGSPTAWAGTSPLTSASSFKEIQMEQVKYKSQQKHSTIQGSPKLNVLGSSSTTGSSTSIERVAESEVTSRWFKPDIRSPSSIRCIQIEETAIKELQQMYKNAKVVRTADK